MQLPGFRASCLTISAMFVFLAVSFLAGGVAEGMARYQVPAETLASAHYIDAMTWVFLHMTTIGLIVGVVGVFADTARMQRAFARLMLAAQLGYGFLDVRAADWALGTALYKGPGSLGPVVVGAICIVLWLRLNVVAPRPPGAR
jgi:hypothetical protein